MKFRGALVAAVSLLGFSGFFGARGDVDGYNSYPQQRKEWHKFYKENFGIEKSFSFLYIPKPQPGFDRLLILPKEITIKQLFEKIDESFSATGIVHCNYPDLEILQPAVNIPQKDRGYAFWVRDSIESKDQVDYKDRDKVQTITLRERLLLELKYYQETRSHLDVVGYTFCIADADRQGNFPIVTWYPAPHTFLIHASEYFRGPFPLDDKFSTRKVIR